MAGSISIYDPICRKLAIATNNIVVSVEYRLAPEFPYPSGVEDAYHVAKNILTTIDSLSLKYIARLSLAGDSAGGALASTVSHITQHETVSHIAQHETVSHIAQHEMVSHIAQHEKNIKISKLVLIYPSLDYTMSYPSIEENGVGYLLEKTKIKWYFNPSFRFIKNYSMISSS